MTHTIENLSHAELKANRADLIAQAKEADQHELASRYVQARTDAKHRDEKLAEQGRSIEALQFAVEKFQKMATAAQQLADNRVEVIAERDKHIQESAVVLQKMKHELHDAKSQLSAAGHKVVALQEELAKAQAANAVLAAKVANKG